MIVFKDGFVWKELTLEQALNVFQFNIFELYDVRIEEETEALIESETQLREVYDNNDSVCIEVGNIYTDDDLSNYRKIIRLKRTDLLSWQVNLSINDIETNHFSIRALTINDTNKADIIVFVDDNKEVKILKHRGQ